MQNKRQGKEGEKETVYAETEKEGGGLDGMGA
jgi:hypothetical protein